MWVYADGGNDLVWYDGPRLSQLVQVAQVAQVAQGDGQQLYARIFAGGSMSDVVVTVPLRFGLDVGVAEGDPAGSAWSGQEWHFYLGGGRPNIEPGERVYIVFNGVLRGYAPLVRIDEERWRYGLVRHGHAAAVSLPFEIRGFRGFRYRWWDRAQEVPFPNWQDPQAALFCREQKR